VVSSSAWANLMPTTASVHTMCTATLTSTTVTCTALGEWGASLRTVR